MQMPMNIDLEQTIIAGRDIITAAQDEVTQTLEQTYNAIIDIWEIDCQGEWVVWVKTGVIALGHALWLILTPSIEEILESYLQPKTGRRGGRRGRSGERERRVNPTGQRRLFFGGGIPDIDNMLADTIPGREIVAGRRLLPGEFVFWTGVQVVDKVAWQWLLAEAATTFAVEWQSGLMKSEKCGSLNDESCQFATLPRTNFAVPNMWSSLAGLSIAYEERMQIGAISTVTLRTPGTEGNAIVICSTEWVLVRDATPGAQSVVVKTQFTVYDRWGTPYPDTFETATLNAGPNETVSLTLDVVARFPKFASVFFRYLPEAGTGPGSYTLTAVSNITIAARGVHFV